MFLTSFKIYDKYNKNKEGGQLGTGPLVDKDSVIGDENQKEEKQENDDENTEKDETTKGDNNNEPETENEAENKEDEENKDLQAKQEDLNKKNKSLSCENFRHVMKMVGRVIINLGVIYFVQFFCQNTVMLRCCDRVDIDFLNIGCKNKTNDTTKNITTEVTRKGKFEFCNMFFQVGMFISKTFIKLVRKIQPIEVYTIVMAVITIYYFIEYGTGFCGYIPFIPINLVLGFFAGGTYAGGFYTILNSPKVELDYKELTVNVATIFNDCGTFVSGILGFVFYNFIINKDKNWDKNKWFTEKDCPKDFWNHTTKNTMKEIDNFK